MKTRLAIIKVPATLSRKQNKQLRKAAKKRLGRKFRVLVLSGDATCEIVNLGDQS